MDDSIQSLDQVKASALDMAVRFGPKLMVALIILFVGYLVGRWAGRGVENLLVRLNLVGHTDRSKVVIPNRKIVGEILHNCGQIRQLSIAVEVSYGTDVNVALRLVEEILQANPRVLRDPEPGFGITRLAESGITISVCPWVNVPDYIAAVRELNKTILETFRARNIVIPLPQCEVRMLASGA